MTIFRVTFAALVGVGITMGSPEDGGKRGPKGERDGGEGKGRGFGQFFEAADTDGDGAVSAAEFAALERIASLPEEKRMEIFKRLDRDGDGMIRKEEMRTSRRPDGRGQPFPRLSELDQNGNGEVTFEEFQKGDFAQRLPEEKRREFFDRLDRNGDGVISAADRPNGRGRPDDRRPEGREAKRVIEMLDEDGDDKLGFEEFRKAPWLRDLDEAQQKERFKRLDRNEDKQLDRSELAVPPKGDAPPRRMRDGEARGDGKRGGRKDVEDQDSE